MSPSFHCDPVKHCECSSVQIFAWISINCVCYQGDPRDESDDDWDIAMNSLPVPDTHVNGEPALDEDMDPLQIIQDAFQAADEIRLMAVSDVDSNQEGALEGDFQSGSGTLSEPISLASNDCSNFNHARSDEVEEASGMHEFIEHDFIAGNILEPFSLQTLMPNEVASNSSGL